VFVAFHFPDTAVKRAHLRVDDEVTGCPVYKVTSRACGQHET